MAAPTFVIGLGATGLRVLVHIKERLLEAYDGVPDQVVLFGLDTEGASAEFNGVQLLTTGDPVNGSLVGRAAAEFYQVAVKNAHDSLDAIFARTGDEWKWLNRERIDRTLTQPGERTLSVGARTVRPVSRSVLFLDYQSVYEQIERRIRKLLAGSVDLRRYNIYVIANAAGGLGSGTVNDVLRMIAHIRSGDELRNAPISVTLALVGAHAVSEERGTIGEANTFALLRELDRLMAVAGHPISRAIPSVTASPEPVGHFSSRSGPADMVLWFDKPDRNGQGRVLHEFPGAYLSEVLVPSIADLILAYADERSAPLFNTVRADMGDKWNRRDPLKLQRDNETPMPGHFPYASAGTHTLIFPERDVRKSAGMRFLLEVWDHFIVSPSPLDASQLPPVTSTLWGRKDSNDSVTPSIFVDKGFAESTVCGTVANNEFIRMVVSSAAPKGGHLQLPPVIQFPSVFGQASTIERVLRFIGLPGKLANENVDLSGVASTLERRVDKSIDDLDRCKNALQVRAWRGTFLGQGALGNEHDGEWDKWFRAAESVQGHEVDFQEVVQRVVNAILNDTDTEKRKLPYRLSYAQDVLGRLERHVLQVTQDDPDLNESGSLLSNYFATEMNQEQRARERVQRLEAEAAEKLGEYISANKAYAEVRRDLLGMRLIESLSSALLMSIRAVLKELEAWQDYLLRARELLIKMQTWHAHNRRMKAAIPVRTYLCEVPEFGGNFSESKFERGLYDRHSPAAWDSLRRAVQWTVDDNYHICMNAPFGIQPSRPVEVEELVHRAMTWACTKHGNPERQDVLQPFAHLGDVDEVTMSARIREFFSEDERAIANRLAADARLASLCPLHDWPRTRLMYALASPHGTEPDMHRDDFYDRVERLIQDNIRNRFMQRSIYIRGPENPRQVVAMEFALGFGLDHLRNYSEYERAYRDYTNRWAALHCLPEEDAGVRYELAFRNEPGPYKGLDIMPFVLHPTVVDILGDQSRLQMFVSAIAIGVIGLLPREKRKEEGTDFYLWPQESVEARVRLSKMHSFEEINEIVAELAPLADQRADVVHDTMVMNRLRLMNALRTFALLGYDVDHEQRVVNYGDVKKAIEVAFGTSGPTRRIEVYDYLVEKFLGYYREYKGVYRQLADLGLVLARVAYDLKHTEAGRLEALTED